MGLPEQAARADAHLRSLDPETLGPAARRLMNTEPAVRDVVKRIMWHAAGLDLTADEYVWASRYLLSRVRTVVKPRCIRPYGAGALPND